MAHRGQANPPTGSLLPRGAPKTDGVCGPKNSRSGRKLLSALQFSDIQGALQLNGPPVDQVATMEGACFVNRQENTCPPALKEALKRRHLHSRQQRDRGWLAGQQGSIAPTRRYRCTRCQRGLAAADQSGRRCGVSVTRRFWCVSESELSGTSATVPKATPRTLVSPVSAAVLPFMQLCRSRAKPTIS